MLEGAGVPFRWAAAVAAGVTVVAAVLLGAPVLDDPQKAALSCTLFVLCSLAATLCCLRATSTTDTARLRRPWLFFTAASAAWMRAAPSGSTTRFSHRPRPIRRRATSSPVGVPAGRGGTVTFPSAPGWRATGHGWSATSASSVRCCS